MNDTLVLITCLFIKHFFVDFPLQKPYQWMNKGTYGHFGGILHALLHGVTTALVLMWYAPYTSIVLGLIDAVVHYHIDWAKMNINKQCGWKADTHEEFWWLLGVDQLLHALTYIGLVGLIT
jgi:Protein of unknown function (DUF3307)